LKIYTKTGDKGETGLVGGKRVSKASLRIETYGTIDELNAALGIVRSFLSAAIKENSLFADVFTILAEVQKWLFVIGGDLATLPDYKGKQRIPKMTAKAIKQIEQWIDQYDEILPKLQHFILPSGSKAGSFLHFSRTVCRRAERLVVRLSKEEEINPEIIIFLNRLSDFLFVMARFVNQELKEPEIPWIPQRD
jgi:cob(I)alamin adenosyltransferase